MRMKQTIFFLLLLSQKTTSESRVYLRTYQTGRFLTKKVPKSQHCAPTFLSLWVFSSSSFTVSRAKWPIFTPPCGISWFFLSPPCFLSSVCRYSWTVQLLKMPWNCMSNCFSLSSQMWSQIFVFVSKAVWLPLWLVRLIIQSGNLGLKHSELGSCDSNLYLQYTLLKTYWSTHSTLLSSTLKVTFHSPLILQSMSVMILYVLSGAEMCRMWYTVLCGKIEWLYVVPWGKEWVERVKISVQDLCLLTL